jgi:tRNA (guanine-N7-)-methyltransferase
MYKDSEAFAAPQPSRSIRSFVLRAGRITDAQNRALQELWPRYGLDPDAPASEGAQAAQLDLDGIFGRVAPRVLEIGFGNGDNLEALATTQPQRDFLGVEVHRAGVGHLMLRAEQAGLRNLRVACHDAVELLERNLAPDSLDEVLILFPDPWHKKRHNKRRLIQAPFVATLASRLRAGGMLQLATDWEPYAQQMLEVLEASPDFENAASEGSFVARPEWRALTRFERRGQRLGHGVWDLSFRRRASAPAG